MRITIRIPKIITVAPAQKSLLDELKLCSNDCSLCGIMGSCAGAFGNKAAKAAGAACKCFSTFSKIEDLDTAAAAACDCLSAVIAAVKADAEAAGEMFDDSGVSDTCSCLLGYVPGQQSDPLKCLEVGGGFLKDLGDVMGKLKNAFRCGREVMDCLCWLMPEACLLPTFTFSSGEEGGPAQPTSGGSSGTFTSGPGGLATGDYSTSFPSIQQFLDCDDFPPGSVP